ncbi:MAG TPA: aminodeoxychorismate/anthranilate synthase component II [Bacteroidales bacterium]
MRPRLLILDNYDSFTYNLVQIVESRSNWAFDVVKNDQLSLPDVGRYQKILFSPGPGLPSEAKVMEKIILTFGETKSILGICLGLQAIVETFGGRLVNLPNVYHGIRQQITILDRGEALFEGIPVDFEAGLYHSWAAEKEFIPQCLKITAISNDDIVMAVSHKQFDIKGVQFHPESYMTAFGPQLLANWLHAK